MPYTDYNAPGVNVIVQRQNSASTNRLTDFLPVFIGTGMTSRSRTVSKEALKANVVNYPDVRLDWNIDGTLNYQIFKETDFVIKKVVVHKEEHTVLIEGEDYEVVTAAAMVSNEMQAYTIVKILDEDKIKPTDLIYSIEIGIENTNEDFDLREVLLTDSYYLKEIFGSAILKESDSTFFNDIYFAAKIAFKLEVEKFFYMEVPREYGSPATEEDIIKAMEKIYFKNDAYRIIPLSSSDEVTKALNALTTSLSNPIDRREIVAFTTIDPAQISDIRDIDELVEKVGGLSQSLNNSRTLNIFGGESVEFIDGNERYVLPHYFLAAAIAAYDTVVGMGNPLSLRELTVFSKLNGPKFRPRVWNQLAKYGVFIAYQNDVNEPIILRHQLTTKQSDAPEDQEYSIQKNFDAVTKRMRDRLKPYAGSSNITDGYLEKLDGTLTSVIEEVKELGWAREITVITGWTLKQVGVGSSVTEEKRNLVNRLKMTPVYPANELDVYLLV